MRRVSDHQGYTNWETFNVGVWMDNEAESQQHSQALVTGSKDDNEAAARLKDWAIETFIGPHNRDAIEDAHDWNSIPEEERIDHHLEDMKQRSPEHEDLFNGLFGQGDVDDVEPTLIDPELVNWLELVQGIKNSLAENHEWEFNLQKGKELGIDFMHQHGSDPDEPKNRMYDAWMRHHNALSEDEIKAQGGKTWDHPQAENKLMMWNPIEAIKAGGSEYGWPHGFGDKHAQEIEQNGGWNERISEVGRRAVTDVLYGRDNPYHDKLREAMAARYTPEQIEQMMQPQYSYDAANDKWIPLNQQPRQVDPTLDQPGDLTMPEDWHTSSSNGWDTMFAQDMQDMKRDDPEAYYDIRRPFVVGFDAPEDPSPTVWIGNTGEYHPAMPFDHPARQKEQRYYGEIWENTNPPVFRNADGAGFFDSFAIPHAERQYYQQQTQKKRASDGADYWTQAQDDWWGTQNSSLFNVDVPGEAPGMPRNMETGFTKPCWCDVGPTDPHEWSGACENGKHPTKLSVVDLGPGACPACGEPTQNGRCLTQGCTYSTMVSTPGQIKMPSQPHLDGWGDAQYDSDTFLDHRMINQHLKTQQQADQYRDYIERQKRQQDNAWPSMGVKEAADNVPGAPVSDSGHWVWLDGKVGFGGTHADIAESLAHDLGYEKQDAAYVSNWLARGHCPEDKAVAVGTLKNNKPFIWNSTRDRNHVWDAVMKAHETRS